MHDSAGLTRHLRCGSPMALLIIFHCFKNSKYTTLLPKNKIKNIGMDRSIRFSKADEVQLANGLQH
jgi:hypothetical protein